MAREAGAALVATAHQADDVLESYLLAKARRGGTASLAGPRARREDGVVRPFLDVARAEIEAYLAERDVAWRRDATNGDLRLARNAIRRKIAAAPPETRAQWRTEAARFAAERDRLESELRARLGRFPDDAGSDARLLDAEALAALEDDLLRLAVEEAARPFARPGHPPMTGRERERLLALLKRVGDFRFEAGRRIAVRRRGRTVSFSARPDPGGDVSRV
jgi:tRNA(Ile)-lysidine synthase